jgi:hypothetical protein
MFRTTTLVLFLSTLSAAVSPALADRPLTDAVGQPSAAQKLKWTNDYGLALAVCKATQKPLLIILEEPQTPAFKILPTTLITQESNDKMLAGYTLCRVDVTTKYGQQVAECFKAKKFPYTAIIGKRGDYILYKKAGKFDTKSWVTTLVEYKSGERKQLPAEFCFT